MMTRILLALLALAATPALAQEGAPATRVLFDARVHLAARWSGTQIEVIRSEAHWRAHLGLLDPRVGRDPIARAMRVRLPKPVHELATTKVDWDKEQVVVVRRVEGSGSITWKVGSPVWHADHVAIPATRVEPKAGTDDMAYHLWIAAIPSRPTPARLLVNGKQVTDDAATRKTAATPAKAAADLASKKQHFRALPQWQSALRTYSGDARVWLGYGESLAWVGQGQLAMAIVALRNANRLSDDKLVRDRAMKAIEIAEGQLEKRIADARDR